MSWWPYIPFSSNNLKMGFTLPNTYPMIDLDNT